MHPMSSQFLEGEGGRKRGGWMDGWMDSFGFLLFSTNLTCSKRILLVEDYVLTLSRPLSIKIKDFILFYFILNF